MTSHDTAPPDSAVLIRAFGSELELEHAVHPVVPRPRTPLRLLPRLHRGNRHRPLPRTARSPQRPRLLWRAFATLPDRCQRLLALWAHAPGLTYAQLATALGMKLGSIGPSRNRCLIELRRKLAILGLTEGAAG